MTVQQMTETYRMRFIIYALIASFFLVQCTEEKDATFLITENSIGKLQKTSFAKDLENIFELDSIVGESANSMQINNPFANKMELSQAPDSTSKIWSTSKKIKIFEKGGAHLLTLTQSEDSIPKIENIRIFDARFITDKGVGINSTFKDIKEHYAIQKIITTRNNVVVYLKNSDMYLTIAKEELPPSLRYGASTNIEAVQIPDKARIKYLMIGWN